MKKLRNHQSVFPKFNGSPELSETFPWKPWKQKLNFFLVCVPTLMPEGPLNSDIKIYPLGPWTYQGLQRSTKYLLRYCNVDIKKYGTDSEIQHVFISVWPLFKREWKTVFFFFTH